MSEEKSSQARRGEVLTFYSFKGGVGRSMAVANVAAIYAQRGKRVLVLDFDFEAPGLHRYFLTEEPARYHPTGPQQGVLNLFDELRRRLTAPSRAGEEDPEPDDAQDELRALIEEQLDSGRYLYQVRLPNPNAKQSPPVGIDFMAAARFNVAYPELVRTFDWQGLYEEQGEIFPALVDVLGRRYDVIFVDSRTGVTDIGSLCTMVLPDKLVAVFTPNEQSLAGALDAGWQAIQGRRATQAAKPLPIFPLVSRVEEGEEQEKRKWVRRARRSFEQLISAAHNDVPVDLEAYFNVVRIPHKSYYAYGERISTTEQAANESGSMAQSFSRLADALEFRDVLEAQQALLDSTNAEVRRALQFVGMGLGLGAGLTLLAMLLLPVFRRGERQREARHHDDEMLKSMAAASNTLDDGRFDVALAMFEQCIENFQSRTDIASQSALLGALLGKAQALTFLARYQEALEFTQDMESRFERAGDLRLRETAVASAQGIAGQILVRMARSALHSGDVSRVPVLLDEANFKLESAFARLPENGELLGYSGYIAFLMGKGEASRDLLTRALNLQAPNVRTTLFKLTESHALPQDREFLDLMMSIPHPPTDLGFG